MTVRDETLRIECPLCHQGVFYVYECDKHGVIVTPCSFGCDPDAIEHRLVEDPA